MGSDDSVRDASGRPKPNLGEYIAEQLHTLTSMEVATVGWGRVATGENFADLLKAAHRAVDRPYNVAYDQEIRDLARVAKTEWDAGLPLLNGLATVATWATLEAHIEDVIAEEIGRVRSADGLDQLAKVSVPLRDVIAMSESERVHLFCRRLIDEYGSRGRGVEPFERVLRVINCGGEVDSRVSRALVECRALRNVIAHRSGRRDAEFTAACPWISADPHGRVRVSSSQVLRFLGAAMAYAITVERRRGSWTPGQAPAVDDLWEQAVAVLDHPSDCGSTPTDN